MKIFCIRKFENTLSVFLGIKTRAFVLLAAFTLPFIVSPLQAEEASCSVCHGAAWQGNALLSSPNLQILPNWYIEQQIHAYKMQWRARAEQPDISDDMAAIAKSLTDKTIKLALQEKQQLQVGFTPTPASQVEPDVLARGRDLFHVCSECHGVDGKGQKALGAPPIAGQHSFYIAAQLSAFGNGTRGFATADINGQAMSKALPWPMEPDDLHALLVYISTLK